MAFDDHLYESHPADNAAEDPLTPQPVVPDPPALPRPPYANTTNYPPRGPKNGQPRTSPWRILWGLFTGISVLGNLLLLFMLFGLVVMFAGADQQTGYHEYLLDDGPADKKIVVINLYGVIDHVQAEKMTEQLRAVREDRNVKGVIVRINSPGGGVTASDQIYDQIKTFRQDEELPVVAFMQGVAASGGYYAAVACDRIIAQPTTITGSIGVIMGHLVLEDLFKEKLGILPVVVKSGPKKDWPSSFKAPSKEELKYLNDKLVMPAYQRFVDVVADGRQEVLTREDVLRLADGSIYYTQEAKDEKLVDEIGYLRDAITAAEGLAGIMDAKVVEYREVFSIASFLAADAKAKTGLQLTAESFRKWTTPELMYLWRPY